MTQLEPHAEQCLALNWPRVAALAARITALLGAATMLPRSLRNQALRLLRPAESMLRRLLVLMAVKQSAIWSRSSPHPEPVKGPLKRLPAAAKAGVEHPHPEPVEGRGRARNFPLPDPLHLPVMVAPPPPYATFGPRIWSLGSEWTWLPAEPELPEMLPIARLQDRLARLQAVLDTPGKHVARMARWLARRGHGRRPRRLFPMRPGRPPGYARRGNDQLGLSALLDLNHFAWRAFDQLKLEPG
ncbi:MAG: hypothetical protein L3J02_01465 [Henriciella sp.]|nr:hypothetical protein [Henriciella sp.]